MHRPAGIGGRLADRVVYIESPAEGAQITEGEDVLLSAYAARPDGVLDDVETVVLLDGQGVFRCGGEGDEACEQAEEYAGGRLGLPIPVLGVGTHRIEVTSRLWGADDGAQGDGAQADKRDSSIVEFQVVDGNAVIEEEAEPADPLAETCPPEGQDAADVTAVELADQVLALELTYGGTDGRDHDVSLCWDASSDAADLVFQLAHDAGDDAGDSTVNDTLRVDVSAPLDEFLITSPDASQVQVLIQVPDGADGYTDGQVYALSL